MGDIVDVDFKKEDENIQSEEVKASGDDFKPEETLENDIHRLEYYITELGLAINRTSILQEYQSIVLSLEKNSNMAILSALNYAHKNFEINEENKNKFMNACEHDLKIINSEIFETDKIENKILVEINNLSLDICKSYITEQFYIIIGNKDEYFKEQKKYGDLCVSLFTAYSQFKKEISDKRREDFLKDMEKAKEEAEKSEETKN